VLILASYGLTNLEIAGRLCISTSAVRTFLNRAFKKLGARKKADAVQLALKRREISIDEISSQDELTYYLSPLGADTIEKLAELLAEK
jgi:orotate phosphoribosyltransferase-like protein